MQDEGLTSNEGVTNKAVNYCKRVGKPEEKQRKVLNTLFPGTSKFNPAKESCAEKTKRKKKAAIHGGKPKTLTAVLLKHLPGKVPKGGSRTKLSKEGRINQIQIRRNMSGKQIKQIVSSSFSSFPKAKNVKFVRCNSSTNGMELVEERSLDGDETANLAGGGSLYLLEVSIQGCGFQAYSLVFSEFVELVHTSLVHRLELIGWGERDACDAKSKHTIIMHNMIPSVRKRAGGYES